MCHAGGELTVCSTTEVLTQNKEALGSRLLAASLVTPSTLLTIHSHRSSTNTTTSSSHASLLFGRFTLVNSPSGGTTGVLRCDALLPATIPLYPISPRSSTTSKHSHAHHAVAATFASQHAVVFCSGGVVASFDCSSLSSSSTLASAAFGTTAHGIEPLFCRKLRGFHVPPRTAAAPVGVEGGEKAGGRRKKRSLENGIFGATDTHTHTQSSSIALVGSSDGVVTILGWNASHPSTGGAAALRVTVVDALYGAIQCVHTISAEDVDASTKSFFPGSSLQVRTFSDVSMCSHMAWALRSPSTACIIYDACPYMMEVV